MNIFLERQKWAMDLENNHPGYYLSVRKSLSVKTNVLLNTAFTQTNFHAVQITLFLKIIISPVHVVNFSFH